MTAALALSAHISDAPMPNSPSSLAGPPAPSAEEGAPSLFASFDGLLAEISQEILAENPELDLPVVEDAQGFVPLELVATDEAPVQAEARPPKPEFSPDSPALVELDDTRHVFMASMQWTPPPRTAPTEPAPADSGETALPSLRLVDPLVSDVDMAVDPDVVTLTEQVTRAVQASPVPSELPVDEAVGEDLNADVDADAAIETSVDSDTPVALKRVDPVQLRALDGVPMAEPVLVSVDNTPDVQAAVPLDASIPVDTPELPVAPVNLDVVRVDIDDDLAVEVRAVDGEVDVALLGADAVKPVMKGVQAELRDSLKRGGYDLGQFEQSEQEHAERRHRRRQHQHQERRDPRRGALL